MHWHWWLHHWHSWLHCHLWHCCLLWHCFLSSYWAFWAFHLLVVLLFLLVLIDRDWIWDYYFLLSAVLDFRVLAVHQLFLYTDKCCEFRQNLVLYWLLDNFTFLILDLHIEHIILDVSVVCERLFQKSDLFELSHFINKGVVWGFRVNFYFWFIGKFVLRVLVGECKFGALIDLSFKGNEKID